MVSGAASISTLPGTVTINQATTTATINWQSFSIAAGELTRFQVPSSTSATLNRVTGGNISAIYGTLQSNGQLYLINPNGIVVGASGKIDTAGFLASTLSFSDSQFNAQGDLNLSGSSSAAVTNQGTISASAGDVYLIAAQVNNSGTITAPKGTVGLAAGSQVLLQKAGDQHLFVEVGPAAKSQATGITNTGEIQSAAAELRAAGGNAYALAINNSGNVAATGITTVNGQVYLTSDGGNITNSGTISAKQANGNGGTVVVDGTGTASTGNTVLNSGTLDASATVAGGQGGSVTLKNMSGTTVHSGTILAKGGQGGAGGDVEVSGSTAQLTGTVDTTAPDGLTGDLLIDPLTFTVAPTGGDETGAAVAASLATNDVTLSATDTVTIDDSITWSASSGTTLTLNTTAANGTVDINNTISGYGLQVNSPNINLTGAHVTTTSPGSGSPQGGNYIPGMNFGDFTNGSTSQINITNSVVTGTSMQIGSYDGSTNTPNSQASLNGSTINLILGANDPGTTPYLQITGASETAGAPGVSITNHSSITTASGNIYIQGTGLLAAGSDATGILISDSTLTVGSAGTPGTGSLDVDGYSDAGNTSLTPNSVFADNSYGVQVVGSTFMNYSSNSMKIKGTASAANDLASIGVDLSGGTVIETFNGEAKVKGIVEPESYTSSSGEANEVIGVETTSTQIKAIGAQASVGVDGEIDHDTTASDNGVTSVHVQNIGVDFLDGTSITASGSNNITSVPIHIEGESSPALSSNGNTTETDSIGVLLSGSTTGVTITNSGLGLTSIAGLANSLDGPTTGPNVYSAGVDLGSGTATDSVTSTGGGTIGIAGMGGEIGAGSSSTFKGNVIGVDIDSASVTTTTGDIAILAAAGTVSGSVPSGASVFVAGLSLDSATVQTSTSTAGANQISGGGNVPPLILIYATDSSVQTVNGVTNFQLGSSSEFAVAEDSTSKLITGDLVMGNYYDLLTTYGTSSAIATAANDLATYNPAVLSAAGFTLKNGDYTITGFTVNPAGLIDLTSSLNQVTNLTAALDGSGGFDMNDSVNLTVGTIGDSTNANYGEIDEAGLGPVTIDMAPNKNLKLTDISTFTDTASGLPVIATTGAGTAITLVTSGTGTFTNTGGASALSTSGSAYGIYAASPGNAVLDGLSPSTAYSTTYSGSPSTINTVFYASAAPTINDILDGTAFTDSGSTPVAAGTTIDLLFDGTVLGSTTTIGTTGAFSFTIGPSGIGQTADLTSGVLLTEPAYLGNTYYQTTSPASTITGIDVWGGTLRVSATTTASNTALGLAAGTLGNLNGNPYGINYTVASANLTTIAGANMSILPNSNYTLDGNITASGSLSTGAGSALTASAPSVTLTGTSIGLNGSLHSTGTVTFATATSGTFTPGMISDSGSVQVGSFILENGTWSQVVGQNGLTALPAFSTTSDFELQGTSTFERFAGIDAANGNADEIADVYGLQGLASPSGTLLTANAELVNNIDASGTATWNPTDSTPAYAGFVPIGNNSAVFTGTFNGQGHTINGLYINQPTSSYIGLFGEIGSEGTAENVGVTDVQINVNQFGGGLAGYNKGTITNCYTTGAVSGSSNSGGLVGYTYFGTISNCYSTARVSATDGSGGLVGANNNGAISYSYSAGAVSGNEDVGGLVGSNNGTISNSYSLGAVTAGNGSTDVGGLVGSNSNYLISRVYSTGSVTAGSSSSNVGGLVGLDDVGQISNAFSTGSVTVGSGSSNVGGLVGFMDNLGSDFDPTTLTDSYSTGAISAAGSTNVGGLVGNNTSASGIGTIYNSFWDVDTAGNQVVTGVGSDETPNTTAGVLGVPTSALLNESTFATTTNNGSPWDFTNIWTSYNGTLTPQLIGLPPANQVLVITLDPLLPISPGNPGDPSVPVYNSFNTIATTDQTGAGSVIVDTLPLNIDIVPGGSGAASADDQLSAGDLRRKLAASGKNIDASLEIIRNDLKDGSTVNTGTLASKWAENTGFSEIVHVDGYAQISRGLTQPEFNDPLVLKLFEQQSNGSVLNDLSHAASGH